MTKKIMLSAAFAMCMLPSVAQQKTQLTLVNKDVAKDTKMVVNITDMKSGDKVKNDTVALKGGKVKMDVELKNASYVTVKNVGDNSRTRDGFFLFPGTTAVATHTADGFVADGSQIYKDINKAEGVVSPYSKKMNEINQRFAAYKGSNRDSLLNVLRPEYEKVSEERSKVALDFIKANPDNEGNAVLVTVCKDPEAAINAMSEKAREGVTKPIYEPILVQLAREKARKEQAKKVADGKAAPDFTLKDLKGNDLSLSSLRGKYVILDFWGSWCVWCVRGIPKMKEMYDKYKSTGKLEILSIDCNDTDAKWREAVEKHDMPWLHVYNPKDGTVPATYAVRGFPTKIVVDPNGVIVKTMVGEDPAFYEYIDTLFK